MELKLEDLQMYKDGYKNIAIQIKELNIIDNETEIKRLEEVVNENQAKIEEWEVHENDQKEFEEYAMPYNEKIREAEAKIVQLEQGKEENKKQQEENKKQQKQMKVHMDNVRKNAENYYNEARKNLEQEWENSEQKKQYDSKKEMLEMLNSRENRTAAESGAIIRLTREIRDIKQAHLNNIKAIDEEYKNFLQDLDVIDNEYGIKDLEPKEPVKKDEDSVIEEDNQENTARNEKTNVNNTSNHEFIDFNKEITDYTQNRIINDFRMITGINENEASKIFNDEKHANAIAKIATTSSSYQETFKAWKDYYMSIDSKLEIEVNSQGISFNEENIEAEEIVAKYKPEVEDYINKVNKEYNKDGKYDKNIIRAIAVKYYQKDDKGNIKLALSGEKKLEAYQKMVEKPEENKAKEHITYDLTKMSLIQRLLGKTKWKSEHINKFREVAYEADGKYAKVIPDKVTELVWKIRRGIDKIKTARLTDGNNEKETIGMKIKSTAKSFRERLAKETPSEAKDLSGVGKNEPETNAQSQEDQEQEQ